MGMLTTVTTTVTFKMPEEDDKVRWFLSSVNVSEWKEITDSGYVSYTKKLTVTDGGESE